MSVFGIGFLLWMNTKAWKEMAFQLVAKRILFLHYSKRMYHDIS